MTLTPCPWLTTQAVPFQSQLPFPAGGGTVGVADTPGVEVLAVLPAALLPSCPMAIVAVPTASVRLPNALTKPEGPESAVLIAVTAGFNPDDPVSSCAVAVTPAVKPSDPLNASEVLETPAVKPSVPAKASAEAFAAKPELESASEADAAAPLRPLDPKSASEVLEIAGCKPDEPESASRVDVTPVPRF